MIRIIILAAIAAAAYYHQSGWATLALSITLLLIIGERQAKRRGLGGLQHFGNYYVGLLVLKLERLFKLTGYILLVTALYQIIKH